LVIIDSTKFIIIYTTIKATEKRHRTNITRFFHFRPLPIKISGYAIEPMCQYSVYNRLIEHYNYCPTSVFNVSATLLVRCTVTTNLTLVLNVCKAQFLKVTAFDIFQIIKQPL